MSVTGGDGVSDPNGGKSESGGGAWKGENEKPAHPDADVTTHVVTENKSVTDRDSEKSAS